MMKPFQIKNKPHCLMIIPGNDGTPIKETFWYSWFSESLSPFFPSLEIILKDMPDPKQAREMYWLPFINQNISNYSRKYLIGHCSGAEAIMRLLEKEYIDGVFLLAGCVNDLGLIEERRSGYYPQQMNGSIRKWNWDLMKKNSGFIVHIGSQDDPFIPLEEMREIRDKLGLESDCYVEFEKKKELGHFMDKKFPELLEIVKEKLKDLTIE